MQKVKAMLGVLCKGVLCKGPRCSGVDIVPASPAW